MAKEFKVGDMYYLPVRVREIMDDTYTYPVRFEFENGNGCMDGRNAVKGNPNLLLTTEEIAGPFKTKADAMTVTADSLQKENEKLEAELAELEKKNLELENENGKLTANVNNLQTDREQYRQSNVALRRTVDALTASEDKNTHRAMLMDSLIEILLEKIEEMRR